MTDDGAKTFGYDASNRLKSATPDGGTAVNLSYDPASRLYQVDGTSTTKFLYDGADIIAEYNGSNNLLRRYVHGPGVDEPLVQYDGAGTASKKFLHADARGSIIALSDASGNVVAKNTYGPYGEPQAGNTGLFQYTGQIWLAEAGLYHYKARAYHPGLGRFLQTDPIGYGDGMNMYAYAGNDPVNGRDPSGLAKVNLLELGRLLNKNTARDEIVVTGQRVPNPFGTVFIGDFRGFITDLCRTTGCGGVYHAPREVGGGGNASAAPPTPRKKPKPEDDDDDEEDPRTITTDPAIPPRGEQQCRVEGCPGEENDLAYCLSQGGQISCTSVDRGPQRRE